MFEDMDPYLILLIFAILILVVSTIGALIPRMTKLNMRQVHLMVALSAGIFLGILFFMLLPETFREAQGNETGVVIWIVAGFLTVLLIDAIVKRRHMDVCPCEECNDSDHTHEITSFTAFAGLAIHAAVDGVVLSIALSAGEDIALVALLGISMHKFADVFALSSIFSLTKLERKNILIFLAVFILITPVAALISMPIVHALGDLEMFIPLAIATGTFMYVGIYSLLPEAFHEHHDSLISFVLVVIGILAIAILSVMGDLT